MHRAFHSNLWPDSSHLDPQQLQLAPATVHLHTGVYTFHLLWRLWAMVYPSALQKKKGCFDSIWLPRAVSHLFCIIKYSGVPLPALHSKFSRTLVNIMGECLPNEIVQWCGKRYEIEVTKLGQIYSQCAVKTLMHFELYGLQHAGFHSDQRPLTAYGTLLFPSRIRFPENTCAIWIKYLHSLFVYSVTQFSITA